MATTTDPTTAKRGPGRPPDLAKREAVLAATRAVLAEVGYTSMTIDAVAHMTGMVDVFALRSVEVFRVLDIEQVPNRGTLAPA